VSSRLLLTAFGVLCAATATGQAQGKKAARSGTGLEPKAIEILKATSSRLAAARTLSFTAVVTHESPSRFGIPLESITTSDVLVQRPDKVRVITAGDGTPSEFYYDGKTMMSFTPAENRVAVAEAPPTIEGALEAAYKSAAIYFPFSDVIVADPYAGIARDGLSQAFYVGQSKVVGATTTDIVAYVRGGVFLQVWIGTEDKLPRMLNAVYLHDPLQLRHRLEMSNWQLDAPVPEDGFTSSGAAGARRIPFANPATKRSKSGK
jgi:hypothetical protein